MLELFFNCLKSLSILTVNICFRCAR
jgi:hypothetical protein